MPQRDLAFLLALHAGLVRMHVSSHLHRQAWSVVLKECLRWLPNP